MATEHKSKKLKLSSSLHELREEKSFTDVVLICAEGEELAAHRVVLSAKSSYFKQMFLSDFKESITKQVDYSHIDRNNMQLILDFIYLNSLENVSKLSFSDLLLLYQTSHLFELKELSEYAWDLIIPNISAENWLDVWNVVVLRGNDSDIYKTLRFIMKNLPKITQQEEFLGLNMSEIMNFLGKINEFKFPTDDNLLEGIIRWSKKNKDQGRDMKKLLQFINFDFISTEYFSEFVECNEDLLDEQFFKKQVLQRLKSKTLPKNVVNEDDNPVLKNNSGVFLKFLFFGRKRENINGVFIYENVGLRIFDADTKTLKCTDNLPFNLGDGIASVQHGPNIYIVGGILDYSSAIRYSSDLTQSFFLYNWKTNSVNTSLPPIPVGVTRNCHVCAVKNEIYVIQNDGHIKNVFLYFSISKHQWLKFTFPSPLNVIACVNINDVLYLVCKDFKDKSYSVYTIDNHVCSCCCYIPIDFTDTVEFSGRHVTVYKGKLFILADTRMNIYHGNIKCQWYMLNTESKIWNIKNCFLPKSCAYGRLNCFAVEDRDLMVYDDGKKILYKYNEESMKLEEVMTVTKYPPGENLSTYNLEQMIIFHE